MNSIRYAITLALSSVAVAFGQTVPSNPADITVEQAAAEQNYLQPLRPQFHYTPIQGHIGDATGLIYYRGTYHLFNMYDEWSRARAAHKRWAHAVSTDLVHWTQMPPVLDTQIDNSPGSGSGVVDWNNSSGLRSGPEKTLIVFYTDYKRGTCVLYSRDAGRTWARYLKNPVIPGAQDARDPTVFWYAPAAEWRMVRYETRGFSFYKSRDLLQWTWLSRIDGYFECPDLIELPVLNLPNARRWVLVDGDGSYVIGAFDGEKFTPETGKLRVDYGKALYAGQTWKKTPEGGPPAYQMFWMRYPRDSRLTWNGQMSFPVELTLWSFADGIRLCRNPIDEIDNLRSSQELWRDIVLDTGGKPFPPIAGDLLDIRAEFDLSPDASLTLTVRGQKIRYSARGRTLSLEDQTAALDVPQNRLRLRILADRSSVEVFADRGEVTFSAVTLDDRANTGASLDVNGGTVHIQLLEANHLDSIWNDQSAQGKRSAQ